MKSVKLILSLFLLCSISGLAQIQSAWRGPERDGIYPDKGLLTQWPEDGPEIIWHYDNLGEGYSSASFYNNKIYISGSEDKTGYIYVLDMGGSLIWKKTYGRAYSGSFPNTRTTPLVTDGKIYMYTGYGVLICMNAENGEIIWTLDTHKELDGRNITWGVTENLLIDGDKLFCAPGGEKYNVIAVNKNTGKLIWSSPGLGDLSAYCSPIIIPRKGRKILVTMMASHIQGHDTKTGEMLWSYEQPNQYSVHPNTPIYSDNAIACVSGYGKGTIKLNMNDDGTQVTKAWFNETLDNRIGACVKLGDYLYGSGDKNRGWHCVDWNTGESKFQDKTLANGVAIAADGMLFCYTDRGELALVNPNPDKFDILSQTQVNLGTLQHWAHPVIRDGKLYLRHGKSLIVYKIK